MVSQSNPSTQLDRLFRVARRDIPSAMDQRQLHAAVQAALQSGQGPASDVFDSSLGRPSGASKLVLKLLTSAGVVAAVLVGTAQLRHRPLEVSAEQTARLGPVTTGAVPNTVVASIGTSALVDRMTAGAVAANDSAPPAVAAEATAAASPNDSTPPGSPATTIASVPVDRASGSDRGAPANTNASDPPVSGDQRAASAKGMTASSPKPAATKPPPSEAALIDQAHRELTSNPSAALALTETHRKLYPKGILVQEREVIAIDALTRLGKMRTAERRAGEFRTEQPHSIHEMRLRGVLGDAGVGK